MSPSEQLNRTELRVATLVWQGNTNPEIASVFGTSEQVIKNHLRNIFDKLGVWSRLELALYVAAHGGASWAGPTASESSGGESARHQGSRGDGATRRFSVEEP
jgi:DNA-binding CsgD family transcriptional regulator